MGRLGGGRDSRVWLCANLWAVKQMTMVLGNDIKTLDRILVTAKPVDTYYSDPSQIRWLWKTANKNSLLRYV